MSNTTKPNPEIDSAAKDFEVLAAKPPQNTDEFIHLMVGNLKALAVIARSSCNIQGEVTYEANARYLAAEYRTYKQGQAQRRRHQPAPLRASDYTADHAEHLEQILETARGLGLPTDDLNHLGDIRDTLYREIEENEADGAETKEEVVK